MLITNHRCELL